MPLKIYRRGQIWHYRGTVAGRRIRGSTGAADKDVAARITAEREATEWKCRLDGPAAVLTFAQAAMLYRAAGKPTRFLEKIEDHWRETLVKDIPAGAIRQAAIDLYPGASAATRNRQAIVPTQAIINHAAEMEICPPIKVKRFKVDLKVRKPVTLEWVQRFTAEASPHLGALAWFMFQTGARVSEALAVRWSDVDLQARTVRIGQSKTKSERLAHMPPEAFTALSNQPRRRERVFLYKTRMAAWKAWRTAIRRAEIELLPFHSCRHGFATTLIQAGVDPVTVAKLGGWRTPRQVLETYGHASDDRTLTNLLSGTPLTQRPSSKRKNTASNRAISRVG
jgi:integrase